MILNLDPDFRPFSGKFSDIEFEKFVFAGGEPHIKIHSKITANDKVALSHRINSFEDLGLLMVTVDALKRMGVKEIEAYIPYFPGARQDRLMVTGEPLTVKIYADIINSLQLSDITIFDPHSEVTPALLNNCIVVHNYGFIKKVIESIGQEVVLISPDGGALKKIYKLSENIGGLEVVECSKSRDVKTGKLSGFKVYKDDLQQKPCLIVDDICDGGGTFTGLAEALKARNAGSLYLAVSHGIFSKGIDQLSSHFEKIYTTDSIKIIDSNKIVQIELGSI